MKESELLNLKKQIEQEFLEKVKVENLIMAKMQEQLTSDKASKHIRKKILDTRSRNNELVRTSFLIFLEGKTFVKLVLKETFVIKFQSIL